MTKKTHIEMYQQILSHLTDPEEIDFIKNRIEQTAKKNAKRSDKPTKKQTENANLMSIIYDAMETGKSYTVSDLIAEIPALAGMNTQRVTPMVTKMRENVLVSREVVKGKAYFTKI